MKKITALLLALLMALSVTAVSFGEAAEAVEPAQYANFEEHLQAFLSGLNLVENDLYVISNAGDQMYQLLVGTDENGVVNLMAGQNDEVLGIVQVDGEAAYLSSQGSTMAVRFDTVQSFIQNLPQKLLGYLSQLGIDPQKVMADIQTAGALLQKFAMKLMPALQQSGEAPEMIITLDSEAFGNLLGEAIDELLADESFGALVQSYAPLFGAQIDASQLQAVWQQNRDQVVAAAKLLQAQLTVNQETGDFSASASMEMSEEQGMTLDVTGKATDRAMSYDAVMVMKDHGDVIRNEISQTQEKTSFWLDIPTKFTQHQVSYQNDQEIASYDIALELNDLGMPVSFLMTMNQEGKEIVRLQYADGAFAAYVQGMELLYVEYKDEVFTLRAVNPSNGQTIMLVARYTENDADHMVLEETVTINDTTVVGNAIYEILDNEGTEYLQVTFTTNGETAMIAQLQQTEKQPFELLKDSEGVNWITEDQLNGLVDQLFGQIVANLQNR